MGGFERRMVEVGHRSSEDCEGARGLSIGHRVGARMGKLASQVRIFDTNSPC
jgi:hypothetical protein